MISGIIITLIFVFAYFGLFCIIDIVDRCFVGVTLKKKNPLAIALIVKNADENVEYITRILKRNFMDNLTMLEKIFIIDMNSRDLTTDILQKISQDSQIIEVLRYSEREKMFEIFKN
jgi:hypothetical protein